jgi:alanyl-tRNA synthetase
MILADASAETCITNIDKAREMGATALFGEKYGSEVRVVKVGDESVELCGGTHLEHTSQVGLFKLVGESSIGAGLRRIEAVTGEAAVKLVHELEDTLDAAAEALGAKPSELVSSAQRTARAAREASKEIEKLKSRGAAETADELAASAQDAGGVKLVAASVQTADVDTLRKLADTIADKLKSAVVVLAGVSDGKVIFVGKVTKDLVAKGYHAGNTLREVAKVTGGGGGGKADFAQAGGKDASKVEEALAKASDIVSSQAG